MRLAAGRLLLRVEVDEVNHTELLTRLGYLHPNLADVPEEINRATEAMLASIGLHE